MIGELSQTAKDPDQQRGSTGADLDATPARPHRKSDLRPSHPVRVNHEGHECRHAYQSEGPQRGQDESPLLASIELFTTGLRFQPMVQADGTHRKNPTIRMSWKI